MSYQSSSKSDAFVVVATISAVIFALAAGWAIRAKVPRTQPSVASRGANKRVGDGYEHRRNDVVVNRWQRLSGSEVPPAEYQLPPVQGSRCTWHRDIGGMESWGFVTRRSAQEVGVDVLGHYEKLDGWRLAQSETLGLLASSWGCTVYRMQSKEVVMVTALPERLSEVPGGDGNLTRVSVVRVAGEEALRNVLGEMRATGGKQ